jgi:lipopolysaccharide transport system ATP-binding protein
MRDLAINMEGIGLFFPIRDHGATRRYWALENVDMHVRHGEKLGVLGNNGAGKSTLLRIMAGALHPDRGTLWRDRSTFQLLSLGVGFVSNLSGRDNAILSGLLQGLRRRDINARLERIKEFSGLGEFFERPINTYSSGMASRLGFSVAIQLEPDVLLIDEVLSVGDSEFRDRSRQALMKRFEDGRTVVLVSHDESTVERLCERVVWVEHGRTVMAGPTEEVLAAYREKPLPVASMQAAAG